MPYNIDLHRPPGEKEVILGTVHGPHGGSVRFYLFIHGDTPFHLQSAARDLGVNRTANLQGGELTENYAFFSPKEMNSGGSHDRILELDSILFEVEEALCKQATGEACGI